MVVGGAAIGAAISAYLVGRLGGRLGAGRVLIGVLLAGMVLAASLAYAPSWWVFGIGRVLLGAVVGGGPALAYAAAAIAVPDAERATAMGFMTSAALFGLASGPVAAGLADRVRPGYIFLVNTALYGATALALVGHAWSARRAATRRARR
jgi:MFS family permease